MIDYADRLTAAEQERDRFREALQSIVACPPERPHNHNTNDLIADASFRLARAALERRPRSTLE